MRVAFITDGKAPVPATRGGAVENLVESLVAENEISGQFEFSVFSIFEEGAYERSKQYKNSEFEMIKCPQIIDCIDKVVYWFAKYVLKRDKLISYRYILQRLYVMSKYAEILIRKDYDRVVLVTNATLFLLLKNKKILRKYDDKVIFYLHNEIRSLFGCKKEVESIRSLIGISNFVVDSFRKCVPTIPEEKCYVLKNGINAERFSSRDEEKIAYFRNRMKISPDEFVVIFAGRLINEKGVLETIEAVKKCNKERIKLLVVGASFYSSDVVDKYTLELKNAAEPIKEKIVFTGYVDYEDMPSIYHLGNVAVLPSIWEEPAGMTMVEAVASGLPLITTVSGGIPEYISSKSAILLNRDEKLVSNIAESILRIMNDTNYANSLTAHAEETINELNTEQFYENFTNIVRCLDNGN